MFAEAYEIVEVIEGGFSDHINDSGGKTMYGVTERVARAWGYKGKMRDLSKKEAIAILKQEFWDKIRLDEVKDDELSALIFDASVNHGQPRAIILAQRAYNVLSEEPIVVDGIIGKNTLKALNGYPDKFKLRFWFLNVRSKFFYDIISNDPSQKVFKNGWTNRLTRWYKWIFNREQPQEIPVEITPEEAIDVLVRELNLKRRSN